MTVRKLKDTKKEYNRIKKEKPFVCKSGKINVTT
jgi:hypothetical protein